MEIRRKTNAAYRIQDSGVPEESRAESGGICGKDGSQQTGCVQVGEGSFPNKKILRNNLCLPACNKKQYHSVLYKILNS